MHWAIKFVGDSLTKTWRDMVCLKGCLPQIVLDPFLGTLTQFIKRALLPLAAGFLAELIHSFQ